jgi:hypothetical protein
MADAGTSLDCGDEGQEGQHAAFPSQGLGMERMNGSTMPASTKDESSLMRQWWKDNQEHKTAQDITKAAGLASVFAKLASGAVKKPGWIMGNGHY